MAVRQSREQTSGDFWPDRIILRTQADGNYMLTDIYNQFAISPRLPVGVFGENQGAMALRWHDLQQLPSACWGRLQGPVPHATGERLGEHV